MKRVVLLIGVVYTFIGCEKNVDWNLPRSNPNDLYNVCFEYNCDSLNQIAIGSWEVTSNGYKGGALTSSREPGEFIEFSYTSTSTSSLSFWISVGNYPFIDLSDGQLVNVYVDNVPLSLRVIRKPNFSAPWSGPGYWWNIGTDVISAGSSTIKIEIPGIPNYGDRRNAIKPTIDEIEIKCH